MGSSTSSNAEAFVQLETTAVHTGEEVIGMVYLNVSAHVELQQIYIQFKGKESTTWWESVRHRDLDGKTRTRMEKRHGSAKLIDLAFPLANYF